MNLRLDHDGEVENESHAGPVPVAARHPSSQPPPTPMNRNGKIACLRDSTLHQLNNRLKEGETAVTILPWLNADPEVKKMLAEEFEGEPINKQNLSAWRLGGFVEWMETDDLFKLAFGFNDQMAEINENIGGQVVDDVATLLSLRYAALLKEMPAEPQPKFEAKMRVLHNLTRDVAQLQSSIHRAAANNAKRKQTEDAAHEKALKEIRERAVAHLQKPSSAASMAFKYGGGEEGLKVAEAIFEIRNNLIGSEFDERTFSQVESRPVKPGQGESSHRDKRAKRKKSRARSKKNQKARKEQTPGSGENLNTNNAEQPTPNAEAER